MDPPAGRIAGTQHCLDTPAAETPKPHTASNDSDLAERHARFANVLLPHLDDAYNLARWLAGSRVDAEDIVQDACLNAMRSIGTFADINARAWVLTIVRNTAYTWLAKNRQAALVYVDDLAAVESIHSPPVDIDTSTPESELIAKTNGALLQKAIAALPIQYREAIVLREVRGLDYHEIAEVTQVPVGTVMSRLARGRHRLKAAIGKN